MALTALAGSVAGNARSRLFRLGTAPAADVAREGYRAMMAGKPMVVHGLKNKLSVQLVRVSPRAVVRAVAAAMNANPDGKARAALPR